MDIDTANNDNIDFLDESNEKHKFSNIVEQKLLDKVKKDLQVDELKLTTEPARIVNCMQYYNELLVKKRYKLKRVKMMYDKIYGAEYYDIRKNHPLKPTSRTDIDILIKGRDRYNKIKQLHDQQESVVEYLEGVVKSFVNLSFAFKIIIEEKKLVMGMQ